MRIILICIVCFIISLTTPAQQNSLSEKLDAMIEEGIEDWQIPGLTTIVVKDGEIVFKKAYGVKDIESKLPVDENTLFGMASTTKAIIAMSVGILVDQGKINWEDKVIDHLPTFRLSEPYITADARVKDLFTHNLGIGNADWLWIRDSISTTEALKKFQYAKQTYPLRGGFTYQNIMYTVVGELIEAVSGQPWTQFVEENILNPLEMNRTLTISSSLVDAGNYITPYYDDPDEGIVKLGYTFSEQIGPAGMMWSSANDISNYLTFIINQGIFRKDTLLKPETFKYLFKPHAIISQEIYPTQRLIKPNWMTYGLGWFQQDYRGNKLDFHTGSLPGLVAIAGVMHDHNMAVFVFANLDHAEIRHAILYKAIDLYVFNDDSRNWHQEIFNLYSELKEEAIKARKKRENERVLATSPTLDLEEYAGRYHNKMCGIIDVSVFEQNLYLNINDFLYYKTEHWNYDTFITNKDPKWREKFFISFNLNQSGKISGLEFLDERFSKLK